MRGNIRTRCFVTIAVLVVSLGIPDFASRSDQAGEVRNAE